MKLPFKQSGVSLIELMIAMVLGLLIIGGVTAIFVGAAGSFNVKRELDRSQENLRFVVNYLVHEVRQATRIYNEKTFEALPAVSVDGTAAAGQRIIIRYPVVEAGNAVHCDGREASAGDVLEKRISVDGNGRLLCESGILVGEPFEFAGVVDAQAVASGLVSISVDQWIESPVRPHDYAPCAYSDMAARTSLPAPCDVLETEFKAGLGLVGVRIRVEQEHVGGEPLTFVTTVALRNAVLEWFTRPERWGSL